jgi:hypothetical protein
MAELNSTFGSAYPKDRGTLNLYPASGAKLRGLGTPPDKNGRLDPDNGRCGVNDIGHQAIIRK